jgi:hypothetical protein
MKAVLRFLGLLFFGGAFLAQIVANPTSMSDARDQEVLDKLFVHLLQDPKFQVATRAKDGKTILLQPQTPRGTGYLAAHQIRIDTGTNKVSDDLVQDLRRRNCKPNSDESVDVSFAKLRFSPEIVVGDVNTFEKAQPQPRAWAEAWLPGYSTDGLRAVVRARVGSTPHGATLTAVLEKNGESWAVKWYYVAFYV